jgi:hypothetical protein
MFFSGKNSGKGSAMSMKKINGEPMKKTDPIFEAFLRSARAIEETGLFEEIKTSTLQELAAEISVDPEFEAKVIKMIEAKNK